MIKITVVIPNYNGMKYLSGCLNALYRQVPETPDYDVLIVDNGSEDGSIEAAAREYPQARIIRLKENTGFCHAVNVGIQNTESPYILLLNNDTKVKSRFILSLYEAIHKHRDIFSVSARMLMWDRPELLDDAGDCINGMGWAYARGKGRPAEDYNRAVRVFSACAGAAIYRRSVFSEIGLFDEVHFAYLEDLDIGYRANIYGYRNLYEPGAEVLHYGSASSGSRYNEFKTRLSSCNSIYVIYKNMPFLQILWNLPFLLAGYMIKWLFFCRKKMGKIYLMGLVRGIRRCFSEEGRAKKVSFRQKNLKNYVWIQLQLYKNLVGFLTKH